MGKYRRTVERLYGEKLDTQRVSYWATSVHPPWLVFFFFFLVFGPGAMVDPESRNVRSCGSGLLECIVLVVIVSVPKERGIRIERTFA